MFMLNKKFLG